MTIKEDVDGARAALSNVLNVAGPILTALQQADKVFGVILNADAHRASLQAEVADLTSKKEALNKSIKTAQASLETVTAKVSAAEAAAKVSVEEAEAAAKAEIAAAKRAAADATKKYADATAASLQEEAEKLSVARAENAKVTADMEARKLELQSSVAALEKKLDSLKASAAKFAAALTGE